MPKIKMQKRSLGNLGILSLSVFLVVGCSTSRDISVVSHGDEMGAVEEAVPENAVMVSPPPLAGSTIPPLEKEAEAPIAPVNPTKKRAPIISPTIPPSAKSSIGTEIHAQSAEDTTLPWTLQDIFFDYDQMAIRKDATPLLEQNAKVLLKRYANREVLIQGHCDERGTEAYNLILGERRAKAVKHYLVTLGVASSQLRVLSLGKNQPFCLERTIACFRQNRRAHFVLN